MNCILALQPERVKNPGYVKETTRPSTQIRPIYELYPGFASRNGLKTRAT
jgi:hypothetical protein